jgi:hypothetical protein
MDANTIRRRACFTNSDDAAEFKGFADARRAAHNAGLKPHQFEIWAEGSWCTVVFSTEGFGFLAPREIFKSNLRRSGTQLRLAGGFTNGGGI